MNVSEKQYRRKKWESALFFIIIIAVLIVSTIIANFDYLHSIETLPAAFSWIIANLMITQESLERLPAILTKLNETIFMSIAATTTGAVVSLFLGVMGSSATKVNNVFSVLARGIASFSRNIPVVAWAL